MVQPNIELNTEDKKKGKNDFGKDLFKLYNSLFCKTMKNVRKHQEIKLETNNKRRIFSFWTKLPFNNMVIEKIIDNRDE